MGKRCNTNLDKTTMLIYAANLHPSLCLFYGVSQKHDGTAYTDGMAGLVADGTTYTDGTAIQLLVEPMEQPIQMGEPFMEQTGQPRQTGQLCRCVNCVSSVPVVDETQ